MNIYDKIASCEKIVCFIEGPSIKGMSICYKKEMLKAQFYEAVITLVDNCAKSFLIKEVTICGYETENSKVLKSLFSGSYTKLQKIIRGVL